MIEVRDIKKAFGDDEILKGISVKFEAGKTHLVIGRSGSGKTVFIKSIFTVIFIFIAVFLLQIYLNNQFINKGNFNLKYLKTFYYTLK